jgi:predicted secreted acid phosphatase
MGQLYGSKQYNDELTDIAAGFFLGSLAIDGASSFKEISDKKYKKWTKKIDLDERILNNSFFSEGFVQKRKEQAISSMRKGRLIARSAFTLGIILFLVDELEDDDDYYKKKY